MSEHEKADQARKGLFDAAKGKAKEVVGAVIKNDELTAQGQVEQEQARQRKEANRLESVADAEAAQAEAKVADAKSAGAEERVAVSQEARAREDAIRRDQAAQSSRPSRLARMTLHAAKRKPSWPPNASRRWRRSRSASRSRRRRRKSSMPSMSINRPYVNRRLLVPRPIASDGRPTACPRPPTFPAASRGVTVKITELPFAVLRFQYQLARFPLQMIEAQVLGRLDEEAPARLMYERSLGRLDMAVGTALGAPDVERRGAALVERSDALARAARLTSPRIGPSKRPAAR